MPQPLKDFIESGEKEFEKKFGIMKVVSYEEVDGIFALKEDAEKVKSFLSQRTTQAYELGKQETLDMVMREIEQAIGNLQYPDGADYVAKDALSTLKEKLST